jgi:hypothetical protein
LALAVIGLGREVAWVSNRRHGTPTAMDIASEHVGSHPNAALVVRT